MQHSISRAVTQLKNQDGQAETYSPSTTSSSLLSDDDDDDDDDDDINSTCSRMTESLDVM